MLSASVGTLPLRLANDIKMPDTEAFQLIPVDIQENELIPIAALPRNIEIAESEISH